MNLEGLKWYDRVFIILPVLILISLVGLLLYRQAAMSMRQEAIEKSVVLQKDIGEGITRSLSQYATRDDINKFAKDNKVNLQPIEEDLAKLHAEINAISIIDTSSIGSINNVSSTGKKPIEGGAVQPCVGGICPDPYGHLSHIESININEDFDNKVAVPYGSVDYDVSKEKPWTVTKLSRNYRIATVYGLDEDERLFAYNKFSIIVNDKAYDIKIDNSTLKQQYPLPKWSVWNPRLYLGLDGGISFSNSVTADISPSVNFGFVTYGRLNRSPDWSIGEVGVSYSLVNKRVSFAFTPVAYNLGNYIPFLKSTYIAPSIHIGVGGDIGVLLGLRVGL